MTGNRGAETEGSEDRCPYCREWVRLVTVGGRQVRAVHSRFLVDQLVSCSGSGETVDNV